MHRNRKTEIPERNSKRKACTAGKAMSWCLLNTERGWEVGRTALCVLHLTLKGFWMGVVFTL